MTIVNFIDVLTKDLLNEGPTIISLKSCIPVFIAYPEIISGYSTLGEVAEIYDHSIDYHRIEAKVNLVDSEAVDKLVILFANVFSDMISMPPRHRDDDEYPFPPFSLLIDVGPSSRKNSGIESPTEEQLSRFGATTNSPAYTFSAKVALANPNLPHNKKHNIMLVDILMQRANNSGLGGR